MALTQKQRRFVDAYMGEAEGNATKAADLAGYKGIRRTLEVVGTENLRKPEIIAALDLCRANDPLTATRDERQKFWTQIMGDETVDLRYRLKASELLGKSQGDFVEKRVLAASHRVESTSATTLTDAQLEAIILGGVAS